MKRISGLVLFVALLAVGSAYAQRGGRGGAAGAPAATGAARTSGDSIGPYDKQVVDAAAADRGRHFFATECVDCHGPTARGEDNKGPNLVRSEIVLHDRTGSTLGPFLKKGHPMQSKANSANLTDTQVAELSHFLKQRIEDALKRQPMGDNINVIKGDTAAGKAFFEGAGKCSTCHDRTAGGKLTLFNVSGKFPDPVNLQQGLLFPGGGRGAVAGAVEPRLVGLLRPPLRLLSR